MFDDILITQKEGKHAWPARRGLNDQKRRLVEVEKSQTRMNSEFWMIKRNMFVNNSSGEKAWCEPGPLSPS